MQLNSSRSPVRVRLIPALLTIAGGFLVSILLTGRITAAVMQWSPTETARQCFYYPITSPLPDGESISRMQKVIDSIGVGMADVPQVMGEASAQYAEQMAQLIDYMKETQRMLGHALDRMGGGAQ